MSSQPENEPTQTSGNWFVSLLLCLVLLGAAGASTYYIFSTEPVAKKSGATKKTAMLVAVTQVERAHYKPLIEATGTVQPAQSIMLRPQISGQIRSISDDFTPGGHVKKGQRLLRVEPADFQIDVQQAQSALEQAEAALELEQGQQKIARAEAKYIKSKIDTKDTSLMLRRPQLKSAEAQVKTAKAQLNQARLNLSRTVLRAPFDAQILSRQANVGSQVSPSTALGQLVGVDHYWIAIELPLTLLRWLQFPEKDKPGAKIKLSHDRAWPGGVSRTARLFKLVGNLDSNTRMARVLARANDPLAQSEENKGKPPLIIGEFLRVQVPGAELRDVVRLERAHVRSKDTAWVMEDKKLEIRQLTIVLQDAQYAYVSEGLEGGELVVTTNLSTPVPGAPLRVEREEVK